MCFRRVERDDSLCVEPHPAASAMRHETATTPRAQRMREIVERRRATRSQGGGDARVSSESDTPGMNWPAPLTVRELAAELRCSEEEVRALIRDGELQTVACGIRPGLVPRHQLDAYLRRLQHRLKDSAGQVSGTTLTDA
jgi:excisionase family DNA binding protein